jgi:hypothetical protein
VRKLTVIFIRLDLDLENPTLDTVQLTHKACLIIQNATYTYRGTLRQFLQDDKGCLAICVMGGLWRNIRVIQVNVLFR